MKTNLLKTAILAIFIILSSNVFSQIIIEETHTNCMCNGDMTGTINLTVTGGVPVYTFNWDYGLPLTQNQNGLPAGTYCVTVTDNNLDTQTQCITITESNAIAIALDNIVNTTNGICNGSIDISATGGTSPYTFLWSTMSTDVSIFDLCPTNYWLTVTDVNNCIAEANYEVGSSYDTSYTFVDTVDIAIDTCVFSNTLPVDSALIYSYQSINPDSIVLNWIFWQDGNSILLDIGVSLETQGSNLVYLEINCSNKVTNTYSFYGAFDATTTGIQKMEVVNINIFPNPSTGTIRIESDKKIEQIEITDINGRVVKQITINKVQCTIDFSKESKGLYFVKLIGENGVSTQKIVLE